MSALRLMLLFCMSVGLTCQSCASESALPQRSESGKDVQQAAAGTYVVKLKERDAIAASAKSTASKTSDYIAAALDEDEKLSPPLLLALASKGKLIGYTSSGQWILAGPRSLPKALEKSGLAEEIAATQQVDFSPVDELVLVYEKAARPSPSFLEDAKLEIAADATRKNIGYMKLRCLDGSSGIAAQALEKIRSLPGVLSVDVNASATTSAEK